MKINATIEGLTPLMMNRFSDEAEVSTTSGHAPSFKSHERQLPRERAAATAYRNPETGELFLPGPNLFAALVEAGRFHKLGKNKVTTQKSSLVPAGLFIDELISCFTQRADVRGRVGPLRRELPSLGSRRGRVQHARAPLLQKGA